MSDREERNVLPKLCSERCLDDGVGLVVDCRRRLVEDEQLAPAHDRPRKREDLALPYRQVRPAACDLAVKRDPRFIAFVLEVEETGRAKRVVQHRIVMLREGVEVLAERPAQQFRLSEWTMSANTMWHGGGETTDYLGDDGYARTEGVQIDPSCRQPVIMDVTFCQDATEKGERERALAAARAANYMVSS